MGEAILLGDNMAFKDPEKKREYERKYRAENADKLRAKARQWDAANPEKAHKWNTEHPDRVREINRKWAATHPETGRKWKAEHPEKVREIKRNWQAANPEKTRAKCARRRALKAETYADLTSAEIHEIKQAGCFFKDATCSGTLTIAHDNPVANKGNTTRGNCFCLCAKHNSQMHTKTLAQKIKQLLFPF